MRLKSGPFVIAAGIGAAIQFAIVLISTLASYASTASLMNNLASVDGNQTALLLLSALGGLICLCAVLLDVATGAGYSVLARRSGEVEVGDGAIGGLLAALVARLVSGLFGTVVSVAVTALMFNQLSGSISPDDPNVTLLAAGSGAITGLIGVCIGAVVAAVLGALGGGVAAAIVSRSAG